MKNTKRNLFEELMEGVDAMKRRREGKITLRTHRVEKQPKLAVTPDFFVSARQSLRMSRRVFARHTFIPERTLEKWEQGRSKPNPEAIALVALVKAYPETVERLKSAVKKAKAARAGA
jgi:putative transcriptional regulator